MPKAQKSNKSLNQPGLAQGGLWKFTDQQGSFQAKGANSFRALYFPLANEEIISSITPYLNGDIKTSQHSFLLPPVSRIDLSNSKASRNFWIYRNPGKSWSACGVSKDIAQIQKDKFNLDAGLLWHKVTRENKEMGLKAEILSFVPSASQPVEIMQVTLTNISRRPIHFTPTAAIPIYGRGADSLRDHRHVTSLLQRILKHEFGVIAKPTLLFDESGHKPNKDHYFVLGWDGNYNPPQYLYPTQEIFCGEAGDLEAPECVLKNLLPLEESIQGKEPMGALRFRSKTLLPGKRHTYTVLMGIAHEREQINSLADRVSR